jgi:glycosyltransferase involved in cell wall biosynthesis
LAEPRPELVAAVETPPAKGSLAMPLPQIAVLVSTFQRPQHLRRALASIAAQRGVEGKLELVVTDDGSRDETLDVVDEFARRAPFVVKFTTHPHGGFRLARCRNEGVSVSEAGYLLFTDGDCLLPPDHVAAHLEFRRRGIAVAGDSYRLDQATSERITQSVAQSGAFTRWVAWGERLRLAKKARRAWIDSLVRHPLRPRLTGSNIAVWREDFERINGFDENYVGWGLEDRDLQLRLSQLGVRFRSILGRTAVYHLWHPRHPTYAHNNLGTPNLRYYSRDNVATRCRQGLLKIAAEVPGCDTAEEGQDLPVILPFPAPAERVSRTYTAAYSRR